MALFRLVSALGHAQLRGGSLCRRPLRLGLDSGLGNGDPQTEHAESAQEKARLVGRNA